MNNNEKIIENITSKISNELQKVIGVDAIVLGGSRVIGTDGVDSNIDIGVYYFGDGVLDIEEFSKALTLLDDYHRTGILAYPGVWGPWLNGGSCIQVDNMIVDISLRNLVRVNEVINECNNGNITVAYQFGHPFGFVSSMYLAEIDTCKILFDKKKNILNLKKMVRPFNMNYKNLSMNRFLWEAEYSSKTGRRAIERRDVLYAAGALYKSANSLIQVVYSLNEEYVLNEKNSLKKIERFKKVPKEFINNMETIFIALNKENIKDAFDIIDYYINELKRMQAQMNA